MKKIVTVVLAAALAFSLTACGSGSGSSGSSSGGAAAPAETTKAAVQISGIGTTTAAPAETQAAPAETQAAPAETQAASAETTAAAAETTAAVPAAAKKTELVVGHPAEPDAFVPWNTVTSNTNDDNIMTQNIYEGMLKMMPDGSMEKLLAKEFEWNDTKDAVHITIRDDVKFCNGEPMTAEDVVWTFNQYIEGKNAFWKCVDHVEQIGDYDLTITLKYPYAGFEAGAMASRFGLIGSKKYFEEVGMDEYNEHPVGSGPYMLTEKKLADHQTFEVNPYYYGEEPFYKKITVKFLTDPNTQMLSLETGEVDVFCNGSLDQFLRLDPNGDVKFEVAQASGFIIGSFNKDAFPSSNLDFRKAVVSAINKNDLNDVLYGGYSTPLDIHALPFYTSCPAEGTYTPTYPYDLEAAKEFLKASGYNGEEFIIKCATGSKGETAAVIIQGALINLGINCTVKSLDNASNSALGKLADGWHFNLGNGAVSDLDVFNTRTWYGLDFFESTGNPGQYHVADKNDPTDVEISRLYEEGLVMPEGEERTAVAAKLVSLLNENVTNYTALADLNCAAYHTYVEGIHSRPLRSSYYFIEWH